LPNLGNKCFVFSERAFKIGKIAHVVRSRELMRRFRLNLAIAAAVIQAAVPVATAADTFYLGTWKIVSAVVAPWATERERPLTTAEMKSLVGKTITIGVRAIRGPSQLACTPV